MGENQKINLGGQICLCNSSTSSLYCGQDGYYCQSCPFNPISIAVPQDHQQLLMCKNRPTMPCSNNSGPCCDECNYFNIEANRSPESGYQACPICTGQGKIINSYTSTEIFKICDVCNGKKIINKLTGQPPF